MLRTPQVTSGAGGPHSPVLNLDTLLAELAAAEHACGDASGVACHQNGIATQHATSKQGIVALLERALRERDEHANGMLEMAQELVCVCNFITKIK